MRRCLRIPCLALPLLTACAATVAATDPEPPPQADVLTSVKPTAELPRASSSRWAALSAVGAPQGREDHTAVWTGTEMLVWGGEVRGQPGIVPLDSGARYDPSTDRWTAMTQVGAPDRRDDHTVVWTGTEMIVWGGNQVDEDVELLASGGRYDPRTDHWAPMASGPLSPRDDATAVWTGTEMIIWGGRTFGWMHEGSGARYDPATDRWTVMSSQGAPRAREDHTAVWTGTEMIIWGGWTGDDDHRQHLADGARYDPRTDQWRPLSSKGAPEPREDHTAVWTGTEMIIWGGVVHVYGAAEPERAAALPAEAAEPVASEADEPVAADAAEPVASDAAGEAVARARPKERTLVQLATGALYDPATDTWRPMTSIDAPTPREDHIALWVGHELLVWGGRRGKDSLRDGARYDPSTDRWRPVSASGPEPGARWNHTAVWADDQVIVWGGFGDGYDERGGRYRL